MIGIVMTYFNREVQLLRTLDSFLKYDPSEFFVVIIDDCSEKFNLRSYPFDITLLRLTDKTWTNPAPVFNIGFQHIKEADIVIIQNAECCHEGDILGYSKRVTDKSYISFGCYSLSENESPVKTNNIGAASNGQSAWYNHPVYRPVGYHFCSAITKKNLIKLNGFDERFSFGIGYEDDYFIHQVKRLGLNVTITSEPFVYHQWHYNKTPLDNESELVNKNLLIYRELLKENKYIAKHNLTPDL